MYSDFFTELASLGAAGIMGAMWLIERKLSQKRDAQLSKAHSELIAKTERIHCLTDVIKENTVAVTKLNNTQSFQTELLKQLLQELHNAN